MLTYREAGLRAYGKSISIAILLSISLLEKSQEKGIMREQGFFEGSSLYPSHSKEKNQRRPAILPNPSDSLQLRFSLCKATICPNFTGSAVIKALESQAPHTHTLGAV